MSEQELLAEISRHEKSVEQARQRQANAAARVKKAQDKYARFVENRQISRLKKIESAIHEAGLPLETDADVDAVIARLSGKPVQSNTAANPILEVLQSMGMGDEVENETEAMQLLQVLQYLHNTTESALDVSIRTMEDAKCFAMILTHPRKNSHGNQFTNSAILKNTWKKELPGWMEEEEGSDTTAQQLTWQ